MSFKAKNLTFSDQDPPFLKQLQGSYDEGSGRRTDPYARPVKKILDDDDDEPTYVDSETNVTLSKDEAANLLKSSPEDAHGPDSKATNNTAQEAEPVLPTDSKPTSQLDIGKIGGKGKRKLGKVIGDEYENENTPEAQEKARSKPVKKKSTKKSKVKLSFDEE